VTACLKACPDTNLTYISDRSTLPLPNELASQPGSSRRLWQGFRWFGLALLSGFAILIQGYHPGLEDDAFYLAAVKKNLNPSLFPHDADFFRVQFQATVFDKVIALSVRWSHIPLEWGILFWQFGVTFLILWGCWRIAQRCFAAEQARWAAVTLVAVLLTLPVSGTGLSLTDQYLHPRALATGLILAAIVAVLDARLLLTGVLLAAAFFVHAIMAAFGAAYCLFLLWKPAVGGLTSATKAGNEDKPVLGGLKRASENSVVPPGLKSFLSGFPALKRWAKLVRPSGAGVPSSLLESISSRTGAVVAALLLPLGWVFEPGSDAWRKAAATRSFYFVLRWHWYEWLGVVAPLALLWWFRSLARRRQERVLARVSERLVYFGLFQLAVALAMLLPARLERLRPLEPMRFLHLVYLLFVLLAGGLLGQYVLKKNVLRWLLLFVPLSVGMFYAQRQMYPATPHLELPDALAGENAWVAAFRWIGRNTPVGSQFAIDPRYMELPGEDYHGFRALAERSVLADAVKDTGMVARVPRLAPRWLREVEAQRGWRDFQRPDFLRLKAEFGVDWVVLAEPGVTGLPCPFRNAQVMVCRVE
jgi:hypothetical protein